MKPSIFRLILVFLTLILLTSIKREQSTYLSIPNLIRVTENCPGNQAVGHIEVTTDAEESIYLYEFQLNDGQTFELYQDEQLIEPGDSVEVSARKDVELVLKHTLSPTMMGRSNFHFSTTHEGKSAHSVEVIYGGHYFNHQQIREAKELSLRISDQCSDSLSIYFPKGGTISSVCLSKKSFLYEDCDRSITYGIMDTNNYLRFAKQDTGRYWVSFGACHWGNEFWLTLE